ncbi:Protein C19orf12 homolog [Vulpes lagopus]
MECGQAVRVVEVVDVVDVVDGPPGEHVEEDSPQALGSRPAPVRRLHRGRPTAPQEQSMKKAPEQPRAKEKAPEQPRAKEKAPEQPRAKEKAPEKPRVKKAPKQHRTTTWVLTVAMVVVTVVAAMLLKRTVTANVRMAQDMAAVTVAATKAKEILSEKVMAEGRPAMKEERTVPVEGNTAWAVKAQKTVVTDPDIVQQGKAVVTNVVAQKLVNTLVDGVAPTKEEKMTTADAEKTMAAKAKSWLRRGIDMLLEMVMQKTIEWLLDKAIAVVAGMTVKQRIVASAVLVVMAAVVAMALRLHSRFIKEPVQEEGIMMMLCSIAEERKKIAKQKGTRFWAFFVGLFRAQPKEAVEEEAWSPLDAWIRRLSKSVLQALMELPPDKKQKLLNECKGIIRDLKYTDDKELNRLVMGSEDLKQQLMWKLKKYLNE